MSDNRKWSILVVLLFFVWGGVSYQWYTCGIKGFCNTQKEVVGTDSCREYLTQHIKLGATNDSDQVRKLEDFLVKYEGAIIVPDGTYSKSDEHAVKKFQEKYRDDVLTPWGMNEPTGFVYRTTRNKVNELYCAKQGK